MDYIINPAWFYWVNVADALNTVLTVIFILAVVSCVVSGAITASTIAYGTEDEEHKTAKSVFKKCIVLSAITCLLIIFVPGKRTLMEMQIARYATYENAEMTVDAIKSAADYIIEAMKQLK